MLAGLACWSCKTDTEQSRAGPQYQLYICIFVSIKLHQYFWEKKKTQYTFKINSYFHLLGWLSLETPYWNQSQTQLYVVLNKLEDS